MIEITFEINGKKVDPKNIRNELERALYETVVEEIEEKIINIRDPKTGEHPKIKVVGKSLDKLTFEITASSEALIARTKKALKF